MSIQFFNFIIYDNLSAFVYHDLKWNTHISKISKLRFHKRNLRVNLPTETYAAVVPSLLEYCSTDPRKSVESKHDVATSQQRDTDA